MAIVLLLIAWLGLTLLFLSLKNTRLSLLKSILTFSVIVLSLTEILSVFTTLNYESLVVSWSVLDVIIIYFCCQKESFKKLPFLQLKLKKKLKKLTVFEQFIIGFSIFILAGIFIQGLIYPTNNWDSMSYHMARIVHWIQNESLAHFRTSIYPQLTSAPFSEQLILTINLLVGNDLFSNAVQFFYLLGLVVAITLLAKQLGLPKLGQLLSAFILIAIPEVILLSSSTHNEIALSFFMVLGIYFLIKTLKEQHVYNFLILGCCLGMATATKHTAYLYLAPFIVGWLLIQFTQIVRKKQQVKIGHYLLLIASFTLINTGHYSRNYQLTASVFGSDETTTAYYVNQKHSVKMMLSNVTRNMSSQFGVPKLAPIAFELTKSIHQLLDLQVNDPATTSHEYRVDPLATHENNGANPYHMILMLLSLCWFVATLKKRNRQITIYSAAVVLSFGVFCFYLKWQPWAKLHAPFFIFYSVVIAHFLITVAKNKWIKSIVLIGFGINALLMLLFNYSRPYITWPPFTSEIKISDDRYKKYFSRFLRHHKDFKTVKKLIASNHFKNIGLAYGSYGMEYQLFLDAYRSELKPIHINAYPSCSFIPVGGPVDCIVSTENRDFITYDGEVFHNQTPENEGYLYLFLKK
jgi:hypothetical protein